MFKGIESCGFKSHGGKDAPYVYVDLEGKASWDVFSEILEKAQVCTVCLAVLLLLSLLLLLLLVSHSASAMHMTIA